MGVFPVRVTAVIAAILAGAALGGCAASSRQDTERTSTTAAPAAVTPHNDDDVGFLQNMIRHDQQGLELSMMVSTNSTDTALIEFAARLVNERNPQIQGFRAQLLQWEVAPSGAEKPVDGMLDAATVDKLRGLSGAEFDTLWLQSMITHHRGAITMSQYEIAHGHSADVISVATAIGPARQAEIDQMNRMLGG